MNIYERENCTPRTIRTQITFVVVCVSNKKLINCSAGRPQPRVGRRENGIIRGNWIHNVAFWMNSRSINRRLPNKLQDITTSHRGPYLIAPFFFLSRYHRCDFHWSKLEKFLE